jgi:hypothetical protein
VRSSCIIGELEDAMTEEAELKKERERLDSNVRHADGLGLEATLNIVVWLG